MTVTWPPTKEQFTEYIQYVLTKSEKQNIVALVYADNPDMIIFDPIRDLIKCEYVVGKTHINGRSVEMIIGKED